MRKKKTDGGRYSQRGRKKKRQSVSEREKKNKETQTDMKNGRLAIFNV